MKDKGTIPKKGSSQWKKNEKTIASHPMLRAARDTSEGFKPGSGISTGVNDAEYKAGYDKIKWNADKPKPKFKVRINGVLQYPEDDNEET
jgi:hypothetical protein